MSAILALWPFAAPQLKIRHYHQAEWEIIVQRDRFTGEMRCRVFKGWASSPSIAYARESLAFRFSPRESTLKAAFKVNDRPAVSWTSVYPTLVEQGATLGNGSLDNPTGGLVILPLSALADGHHVTIRPTPKSQPRNFKIDGVAQALLRAIAAGCSKDADFVR